MENRNEKVGTELLKAIMQFQEECPILYKDSSSYSGNYVGLTKVDATIKPLLRKHGLIYTQFLTGVSVNTTVWHVETGQHISESFEIPDVQPSKGMNGYQNIGSGITYIRRYALCSALGVIADADKDASGLVLSTDEYVSELKGCQNIEELENLYKSLSSTIKRNNKVVSAFATRKQELK